MSKITPKEYNRIFLIVNRFAGHREKIRRELTSIYTYLRGRGCDVEVAWTEYPKHATQLAADAAGRGFKLIVAVGGDGTVNETAEGVAGTDSILGILPAGSGNGLARELGISLNLSESKRTLLEGEVKSIDVGRFNSHRFLCTAGIGFDAKIAEMMTGYKQRKFIRYLQLALKEIFNFKPFSMEMIIDEVHLNESLFMITFANASQFGNNARIAPNAQIDDSLIDVIIIYPFKKIWLPLLGIGLFMGLLPKFSFVKSVTAKKIEIIKTDATIFHHDGEPRKLDLPASITLERERIKVVVNKNDFS